VLIALELVAAGGSAVIVPTQSSWLDAAFAELDGIIVNHARRSNLPLIQAFAKSGRSVFILDEEGYLSSNQHAMLVEAIGKLDVGRWVEGYFVWGEASARALGEADPRLADKIVATGCPRFDLLAPRWRGMLRYEHSGYVLINPNFNQVNPHDGQRAKARADLINGGWEPGYLDRFLADMESAFAGFLRLCAELPRRLPQVGFVIRPHPFEAPEPYAKATAGLTNVHLNTEGAVMPVLANARCLVHLNCNTSVEARLLGVPAIQLGFLASDLLRGLLPIYAGVSIVAEDMDDLCRLVGDSDLLAKRDNAKDVFERWIRPAFHSCDGYAARRVVQSVLARCRNGAKEAGAQGGGTQWPDPLGRRLKLALGGLVGTSAIQALRRRLQPHRRVKSFSRRQVQTLAAELSRQQGTAPPPVGQLRSPWTGLPMSAIRLG
jgi:surface carbohydrate biosynthesis protein